MWSPVEIELINFKSHLHTLYKFQQRETTLIYGNVQGGIGEDSNGAGKSSILVGIRVALVGVIDEDVDKSELVQDNYDSCSVRLLLKNSALNKTLQITRKIY